SNPEPELRIPKSVLIDSGTCTLHKLLPGVQNGVDLVFNDIADRHPESVLLSCDELGQATLQRGRIFRAGNFCIRRLDPTQIFRKDREEDSNRIQQRRMFRICFFLLEYYA